MKTKFLSICIPTYNGGKRLKMCLDCIVNALSSRNDVEVIISDNCSIDNIYDIISEYLPNSLIRVYRNDTNLGFIGNVCLLIDYYAKGEYCWILGDDDFIDADSLDIIMPLLKKYKPDFMSLGYRTMTIEKYKKMILYPSRKIDYELEAFYKVIEDNANIGNVMNTFMSTHIFKLLPIKNIDKSIFINKPWDNYKQIFPNSYMITTTYYKSSNCCYLKTPIFTGIIHPKNYGNKWNYFVESVFPEYLLFCEELYNNKIKFKKNRRIICRLKNRLEFKLLLKEGFSQKQKFVLLKPSFYIDIIQWGLELILKRWI